MLQSSPTTLKRSSNTNRRIISVFPESGLPTTAILQHKTFRFLRDAPIASSNILLSSPLEVEICKYLVAYISRAICLHISVVTDFFNSSDFLGTSAPFLRFIKELFVFLDLSSTLIISFESQTRNYITCFGYICNYPHGQENHTQKYINMVLIAV